MLYVNEYDFSIGVITHHSEAISIEVGEFSFSIKDDIVIYNDVIAHSNSIGVERGHFVQTSFKLKRYKKAFELAQLAWKEQKFDYIKKWGYVKP